MPPLSSRDRAETLIGEHCANLVITRVLGSGGYGAVYIAENRVRTKYAVKCLFKKGLLREELNAQKQEIFINRRLGHDIKNVVFMEDVVETDEHLYLVFEYCSRGDLFELIRRDGGNGLVDKMLARNLALQLIAGVQRCHLLGIYHRDIKPENILISDDWTLKLGDFGLATTTLTPRDHECGSPPYMAPELFSRPTATYNAAKADIWSMGIVIINLLLGINPWDRAELSDPDYCAYAESTDPAEHLRGRFNITAECAAMLAQVLNPDPVARVSNRQLYHLMLGMTVYTLDPTLTRPRSVSRAAVSTSITSGFHSSASLSPAFHMAIENPLSRSMPDKKTPPLYASSWADDFDDDEDDYLDAPSSFAPSSMPAAAVGTPSRLRDRFSESEDIPESDEGDEDEDDDDGVDAIFEMEEDEQEVALVDALEEEEAPLESPLSSRRLSASASSRGSSVPRFSSPSPSPVASSPSLSAVHSMSFGSDDSGSLIFAKEPISIRSPGARTAAAPTSDLAALLQARSVHVSVVEATAEQGSVAPQRPRGASLRKLGNEVDCMPERFDPTQLPSVANEATLKELAAQLDSHLAV